MAGKPGECGEGGPQTGGQHDPPGRQPAPHQGGDGEPESGPRGHGTQKRYNILKLYCSHFYTSRTRVRYPVQPDAVIQHHAWIRK